MQYDPNTLRKLQLAELQTLLQIDRVCKKHGIPYFLDGGTALGAVRHKGFIPWDDDMDIGMLRPDYERFLEVARAELEPEYELVEPRTNDRLAGMFAKVWKKGTVFETEETRDAGIAQGIFVDIFPYDRLSADAATAQQQRAQCRKWQSVSYLYHSSHINVPHAGALGFAEKAACSIAHCALRLVKSHKSIVEKFEAAAALGSENPGSLYFCPAYPTAQGFPESIFLPTKEMLFENVMLPVPGNVEELLVLYYSGTWNELPPEDQRKNHAPLRIDFGSDDN